MMATMDDGNVSATDAQVAASHLHSSGASAGVDSTQTDPYHSMQSVQSSSKPVEMTDLSTQTPAQVSPQEYQTSSGFPAGPGFSNENESSNLDTSMPAIKADPQTEEASSSSPINAPSSPTNINRIPLKREQTAPAIGPSSDQPTPILRESEEAGPLLIITLLLNTGARHPYKIDEKYLKKRNVNVTGNDPVNMSVYTLKELIWREWREEWEARPSSPSSIRLIHFGKMLDDKAHLKDGKFVCGDTPHVVHMTVKPQEIVDEEDARIAKGSGRDRDTNERSPGCRCVML